MQTGLQKYRRVYWLLAIFIVVVLTFLVWIYSGPQTTLKQKAFQIFPLPMALVNGRPIPMSDFTFRLNAAMELDHNANPSEARVLVYGQLIKEEEISQLAGARDVSVSQKQVDAEFSNLSGQKTLQGTMVGLNDDKIKNQIVKPVLLQEQLRLWFNSQKSLNDQPYKLANSLTDRISKDSGLMPALAGQFSEDPTGKNTKGDLGFLQTTDLSPELRETVSAMKKGDVKIIPGILGIYIFRLEDQMGNKLHLREIFLDTSDFNAWLNAELNKFKVINFVKI